MSAVVRQAKSRDRRSALRAAAWYVPIAVAGFVALRWGVGDQSFIIVGVVAAITFLPLPSWFWAAGALGVAILMRGLTSTGLLPNILDFADFGFVYVGIAAVLIRRGSDWDPEAKRLGKALLGLLLVCGVSWVLNPSDLARPFLSFVLWAEPFALILLLLIEPPSPRRQRLLLTWFGILVAVQIPFALYQAWAFGLSDPVVGTLTGSGAGAHLVAALTALAGLALLSWGYAGPLHRVFAATLLAAPLLIGIPLLADAKQVIFALPLAALALIATTRGPARRLLVAVPPILALYVLLVFVPAGKTALAFLQDASQGDTGKLVGLEILRDQLRGSLSGWAFGVGPANGLSRAAYLTRPDQGSPLLLLELEPAPLPPIADAEAARVAGGTSFNTPLSSAVGVLTDIGIVGVVAYATVIVVVMLALWRRRRYWMAQAAIAGWVMSAPLAITFDWWEEPPFMLALALLTALAIIGADRTGGRATGRTDRA